MLELAPGTFLVRSSSATSVSVGSPISPFGAPIMPRVLRSNRKAPGSCSTARLSVPRMVDKPNRFLSVDCEWRCQERGGPCRWRMVPKLGPTRIGGASVSSFKSELEPQLDLRPKHLPDDGGQPQSNRSS